MRVIDKRGDRDDTREIDTGNSAGASAGTTESGQAIEAVSGGGEADRVPPRGTEAEKDLGRPAICEYQLGIALQCGHCGDMQFHASAQFVQGAMINAQFQGPCPKCHGQIIMRPKQQVIMLPQDKAQDLMNRNQHRAFGKTNGRR